MVRAIILVFLCCAFTTVNAQQEVQAVSSSENPPIDALIVDTVAEEHNSRGNAYANFLWGNRNGYLNIGVEVDNFHYSSVFSGRVMLDLNIGGFDSEAFVGFRGGYVLGANIASNFSLQGFAALGFGTYSGNKNDEDEAPTFDDEDELFFVNTVTLSCGSSLNFSYFYPLTLCLRAEVMGIAGGGFFGSYGGGIKYTLRHKR